MFRQQDTLDLRVYSKNTSQKYTHVQVAKYLMKKKEKKNKNKQEKEPQKEEDSLTSTGEQDAATTRK